MIEIDSDVENTIWDDDAIKIEETVLSRSLLWTFGTTEIYLELFKWVINDEHYLRVLAIGKDRVVSVVNPRAGLDDLKFIEKECARRFSTEATFSKTFEGTVYTGGNKLAVGLLGDTDQIGSNDVLRYALDNLAGRNVKITILDLGPVKAEEEASV